MLRKLLIISSLFLVFSCQGSLFKKNEAKTSEMSASSEPQENYQTIENEQQAALLNQQAAAQSQEIEVQDRIFFAYDSSALSGEAKKILDVQLMWLKSDTSIKVMVEGHCDERGTREYNIALGARRANAVQDYLVKNGIAASRIKTTSYGKERPAFFGNTDEIFAKNRRAVTVIAE